MWLIGGAERFRRDAELRRALLAIARHSESRRCLLLLNAVMETPGLVDRLFEVLGPAEASTAKAVALRANPLKPKAGLNGAPGGAGLPHGTKAAADPSAARVRRGEPASVGMTKGKRVRP
jgi:hypothetical protein